MQQMVVENGMWKFAKEVNSLLMDGWKVVPGTNYAVAVECVAVPGRTHSADIMPNGKALRTIYMVTLENPDVR